MATMTDLLAEALECLADSPNAQHRDLARRIEAKLGAKRNPVAKKPVAPSPELTKALNILLKRE